MHHAAFWRSVARPLHPGRGLAISHSRDGGHLNGTDALQKPLRRGLQHSARVLPGSGQARESSLGTNVFWRGGYRSPGGFLCRDIGGGAGEARQAGYFNTD